MATFEDEDEQQAGPPRKPFCPKCGSNDIRVSQSHRVLDNLLKTFSLTPYRCRSCRKRFYLRKADDPPAPEEGLDRDAAGPGSPADAPAGSVKKEV